MRNTGAMVAALLLLAVPGQVAAQSADDGAQAFKRCAACHLGNGAGVPGAFPPLRANIRALAAKPEGRRYLALVVTRGVSGPITVEGKPYRGVMPAQAGLSDTQVAAALNHILSGFGRTPPAARPFTVAEIAKLRASGAGMAAAAIGKLSAGLSAK